RRELYLSNITFDRIEVFSLATNSFVASIPVGSRPWGLSMWPRDTAGAYADTLIVANSGGTNLSIVDMVSRAEVRRHRLPNYHIQSVKTSTTNGGGVQIDIVEYEVSDRPQYVAATCRVDGAGNCVTVLAVYSTTPTPAQTGDLANRGYVAWDNLSAPGEGHLFWEPSEAGTGDSLQLIATRFDTGSPVDTILVGAGSGIIVNILETLTFQDSTFVRASGNFLRALIGEGGTNEGFARVLMYDPNIGLQVDSGTSCALVGVSLSCHAIRDNGVSTSTFVSDFLVNRASPVRSIAINHSGRTALVRADSVYAFDVNLRQAGILQVGGSGGAVGMDFHPCNNFDANTRTVTPLPGCAASYTSSERLVFTARPDSSIDVFDTYFFGRVTDTTSVGAPIPIPIRNALIGPVRVATDAGETVLFGLTSHGLVQVRLPNVTNSLFPVRRRSVAAGGGGSP
ncbi:MAG TPA: hypothetical protein VNL98_01035, partial [Gemmatimonadales bacterium]|nr:hypothetical protein [Gemmatimonadales bacterium]